MTWRRATQLSILLRTRLSSALPKRVVALAYAIQTRHARSKATTYHRLDLTSFARLTHRRRGKTQQKGDCAKRGSP